jgi:hypothetical protein
MRFKINKGGEKYEDFIQPYTQTFVNGLLKIESDTKIPTQYSIQFSPAVSQKYTFYLQ